MRRILLATCLMFAGSGLYWPALAQEAPAARSASSTVGDVVITAERRTQSVQSSSLAIQVLSANALTDAGVSQIRDLTAVSPGVVIGQGGPATQVYIRGVGDFGSTPIFNPAVATYIDGVYVARANAMEGNFFDISRVEVLKGPQGTLYGRNAEGGAINILTNPAVLGHMDGGVNVEIGNYNALTTDGFLNVPLGDDLAVRAAFQIASRDGYSSMGFDDDHHQSARLNATWRPNDDFSLRIGAAWTHVGGIGAGYDFNPDMPASIRAAVQAQGITIPSDRRLSFTDPRVGRVVDAVNALSSGYLQSALSGGALPDVRGAPFTVSSIIPTCVPTFLLTGATLNGVSAPMPTPASMCQTVATQLGVAGAWSSTIDTSLLQTAAGQDNNYWNVNAELNWNLGFANLTIIPAYRDVNNDYVTFPTLIYDNGGRNGELSRSKSLETRLAHEGQFGGLLDWVIGAYGFQERQNVSTGPSPGEYHGVLLNSFTPGRILTTNWAVFTQETWHLSDALRVITGVRYSHDDKSYAGATYATYPSLQFLPGLGFTDLATGQPCGAGGYDCLQDVWNGEISFNSTNWKIGVEYDLTPHNMLFATVATGTKAGGLNSFSFPPVTTAQPGNPLPYQPEELTAYELGSRNRFFDGRLQANFEAFYWKYDGHQENVTILDAASQKVAAGLQNAGRAEAYGAEMDIVAQLTSHDVVRFNAQYLHTEYKTFSFLTNSLVPGFTTGCPVTGPINLQNQDCTGRPLTRSPEWSGAMSYTHTFDLENGGTVDAAISGQFATENYMSSFYTPQVLSPDYFTVGANVTYTSPDGNWTLSAYGRNLTDETYLVGSFQVPGYAQGLPVVNVNAPRTYGIQLGLKF